MLSHEEMRSLLMRAALDILRMESKLARQEQIIATMQSTIDYAKLKKRLHAPIPETGIA